MRRFDINEVGPAPEDLKTESAVAN